MTSPQLLRPEWFLPMFVGFWLFISAVLALLGGWHSLAREFRSNAPTTGSRFLFVSGSLGRWPFPVTAYGNCLFVTVGNSGFRMAILLPFRFMSPALSIPWSAVKSVEERRFLFLRYSLIRLHRRWPDIALRGKAGRQVALSFAARSNAP